jgi:RNA polymerase sigma factor for flagellar operon FliA
MVETKVLVRRRAKVTTSEKLRLQNEYRTVQAATPSQPPSRNAVEAAERDQIVLEHLPLVKAIAAQVRANLPLSIETDDLIQAGTIGLFDAVLKFDIEKQVAFKSYAKFRIRGAILDSLRQLDWASRDMRRQYRAKENTVRELTSILNRQPTQEESAAHLGVSLERWRFMENLQNSGPTSTSCYSNEDNDFARNLPSSPASRPDSICAQEELSLVLENAMQTLPERYRRVVLLYYRRELTMKEVGGMMGINESRVSQIHKSALQKLATILQDNGIVSSAAF